MISRPIPFVNKFIKNTSSRTHEEPRLTHVFEIPGSGLVHNVAYSINPRADSIHAVGRERGCVPDCGVRSISGVSGENRLPCAVGGVIGAASDTVAVISCSVPDGVADDFRQHASCAPSELAIRPLPRLVFRWRLKALARGGRTGRCWWKGAGRSSARMA